MIGMRHRNKSKCRRDEYWGGSGILKIKLDDAEQLFEINDDTIIDEMGDILNWWEGIEEDDD